MPACQPRASVVTPRDGLPWNPSAGPTLCSAGVNQHQPPLLQVPRARCPGTQSCPPFRLASAPRTPQVMQPAMPGPATTHHWPAASTLGTAWQPTRLGANQAHQTVHIVNQHNRSTHIALLGETFRAYSMGNERKRLCEDALHISYRRPLFQGQEK